MHPRNQHAAGYDFSVLSLTSAALQKHLKTTPDGQLTIDFANPTAVKMLNRALLMHHYDIKGWDIPAGYLCPPIPGRADYIHTLADLLAKDYHGQLPRGPKIRLLDVGTGANLAYPLIGQVEYGWSFLGSDIDPTALENAAAILAKNTALAPHIELRHQPVWDNIFTGLLRNGEHFAATLCNPPFHASPDEVLAVSQRKWNNLGKPGAPKNTNQPRLNFGGGGTELWCNGGERGFIKTMIQQSRDIPKRALWFTTLVSKGDNLTPLEAVLKKAKPLEVRTLPMAQGQKQSRLLAWTFCTPAERSKWLREHANVPGKGENVTVDLV